MESTLHEHRDRRGGMKVRVGTIWLFVATVVDWEEPVEPKVAWQVGKN